MKTYDLQGKLAWHTVARWQRFKTAMSGLHCYWMARFWGVNLGPGCTFFGRAQFSRAPGSQLSIGSRCSFRSAVWSNTIGINRPCLISTLHPEARLKIGSDCGLSGTVIAARVAITLGDRVLCGGNCTISDTDRHGLRPESRNQDGVSAPVIIEDDVWLGLNVTVLKGVTIGRGSVIGAGSVVTRSIPENSLAAGLPARVLRKL